MEFKATLSKSERLKSKKEIDKLFKQGQSLFVFPFKLFYRFTETDSHLNFRMGVTVPKSMYKKAVDRNRIKRKVRESYRNSKVILLEKNQNLNLSIDLFFVYISRDNQEHVIQEKMPTILSKLEGKMKSKFSKFKG